MAGNLRINPSTKRALRRNPNLSKKKRVVLGDGNGVWHETEAGLEGYVRVREQIGVNAGGDPIYGTYFRAQHNGANIVEYDGAPIDLRLTETGEYEIAAASFQETRQAGINPALNNPISPYRAAKNNLDNVSYLRTFAIATSATASMLVSVHQLFYVDQFGAGNLFNGATVDLTSSIPGTANTQRLVLLYLDTTSDTIGRVDSTPTTTGGSFTYDDFKALIDAMPPNAVPSGAWIVKNGDTTITGSRFYNFDPRQWINLGHNIVLKNTSPGTGDDNADGYAIGSIWCDQSTTPNTLYICEDASAGAASWQEINSGSSGVTSVALTMPAEFSVTGSPITTSGTLAVTKASQTANTIFAAPDGSSGAPTFRAMVSDDIGSSVVTGANIANDTIDPLTKLDDLNNTNKHGTALGVDPSGSTTDWELITPGRVQINVGTEAFSGAASLAFDVSVYSAIYDQFVWEFVDVVKDTGTGNTTLEITVTPTQSYDGAFNNFNSGGTLSNGTFTNNAASIFLGPAPATQAGVMSGYAQIDNPHAAGNFKNVISDTVFANAATNSTRRFSTCRVYDAPTHPAVTNVTFTDSGSHNISGIVKWYGIRKP